MSVYYNFAYVDLNEVNSPCSEDDQFYILDNQKSYESLSNPILFRTMNNHFVRSNFNNVVASYKDNIRLIKTLKFVFGNMFWGEILAIENEDVEFLLNYWNLDWQPNPNKKYKGFLDWFSIHHNDIKRILVELNKIDLTDYFQICANLNELSEDENFLNRTVIQEWIKMYNIAIEKKKGIVYDIG